MNTIAIDTLDRMAVQLQGILEARAALQAVGSLEDHIASLTVQRDGLLKEVDAANVLLVQAEAARTEAQHEADSILQASKDTATKITDEANAQAAQTITDASEAAAKALADERAQREANLANLNTKVIAAQNQLKELEKQIAASTEKAQAAEQRAADAQESLEKVRAAAAKLVG